jgi:hypothetical protein
MSGAGGYLLSHLGFAAAVIGMARRAVIGPVRPRVRQDFRGVAGGVRLLTRAGWHGHGARAARSPSLQNTRRLTSAEAVRTHQEYAARENDYGK